MISSMFFLPLFLLAPVVLMSDTLLEKKRNSLEKEAQQPIIAPNVSPLTAINQKLLKITREAQEASTEKQLQLLEEKKNLIKTKSHLVRDWLARHPHAKETQLLLHSPSTTVEQLVAELSTDSVLYLMDSTVAKKQVTLLAKVHTPQGLWQETLQWIFFHAGIRVETLSSHIKRLVLDEKKPQIAWIIDHADQLPLAEGPETVCWLYTVTQHTSSAQLLQRLQPILDGLTLQGSLLKNQIVFLGKKMELEKLSRVLSILEKKNDTTTLRWIQVPPEMAHSITKAIQGENEKDLYGSILPVDKSSILLYGSLTWVEAVEKQINDMHERSLSGATKKLFHHICRHIKPDRGAEMIRKLLTLLTTNGSKENIDVIIDTNTNTLIAYVDQRHLKTLHETLLRIDQPPKMVKIDFTMLEKKTLHGDKFGLQSLKVGAGTGRQETLTSTFGTTGIFDFTLSTKRAILPSLDANFQFLMNQENIRAQSNPSVLTMSGIPAKVRLVEEMSISMGRILTSGGSDNTKDTFERAEYGIHIETTPTVHQSSEQDWITMDIDLTFETPVANIDNRPKVMRRNVKNMVRIKDGETIILGGLKQKDATFNEQSIPFFRDIPGIGPMFRLQSMTDSETEVFLLITPIVVQDNETIRHKIWQEEAQKRPGDLPEWVEARFEGEKKTAKDQFDQSLQWLDRVWTT